MKEWEVTYTEDTNNLEKAIVVAKTYTMAIVEFLARFPNAYYTEIKELMI